MTKSATKNTDTPKGITVQLDTVLKTFNDEPIKVDQSGKDFLTIGKAIRNACGSMQQGLNPEKKVKRFKIGLKCAADSGEVSLSNAEASEALAAINDAYPSALVYGRAQQMLDPNAAE